MKTIIFGLLFISDAAFTVKEVNELNKQQTMAVADSCRSNTLLCAPPAVGFGSLH